MKEIVKYHNDMNAVNFHGFNAVELDLLLSICAKIRDEGTKTIVYSFEDLRELSRYTATATNSFVKDLRSTYRKLIHLTFCIGTDREFTEFVLFTKYRVSAENQEVTISVNEEFSYVLNELTANFTRFELNEFVNLQSKYAKNLYRLLKQYRSTGKVYFTLDEFRAKLDVPKSYQMTNIDQKVLTPIKDELTPLFSDFKIEKVKNLRKRGKPVTNINFYFSPQRMIPSEADQSLDLLREVYLPDFTLEEIKVLLRHGSQEHLKRASKQYYNYKDYKTIQNKMGFMVKAIKNIANESSQTQLDIDDMTENLFQRF